MKRFIITIACLLLINSSALGTGPGLHGDGAQNIVSSGSQSLFKDGDASAPSISFIDASTRGFWRRTDNILALAQFDLVFPVTSFAGWATASDGSGTIDLKLFRDAAGILAQRDGTNAQTLHVYNTFTDASNYERLTLRFNANIAEIFTANAGTGSARQLDFGTGGVTRMSIDTSGNLTLGSGTKHDGYVIRTAAEVQTTDATVTVLDNITLLDENTYHVEAFVIGVQSDGTDRASYHLAATVFRTAAGSATLQGTVTSLHTQESNAALDATFTVATNDVRVSVTGIAAETWEWGTTLKSINMSN